MHRLFVALRPPREVRDQLADLMTGLPELRWQTDDQLHLTLRFIGEVHRPLAEDIAAELGRVRFDPFRIQLNDVGIFERRRNGTLWAGVHPREELAALSAKVERACQSAGVAPERRAFHPHITLARWKGRPPGLERFLENHAAIKSEHWAVDQFLLYESRLGREGARYELVERYPLLSIP